MLAFKLLRKVCNEQLIFDRKFFTDSLKGKVKITKCEQTSPFVYNKRNIHMSKTCLNQDPYTVLGISRNATTNEIKKQFRILAKKYHPDINPSPDAKQKMADITAAYELLSDPKKKEFYDKTGMSDGMDFENHSNFESKFSGFGDASFMFTDFAEMFTNMSGKKNTSTRGEDIQTEITLKFMEAIKGSEKNIRLNVKVSCNNCNGSGKKPGTNLTTCKVCNGSGIQRMERGPIIIGVPCRNCSGNGQIINNPCKFCSGSGVKFQTKNIALSIPAGMKKGMQMRIPNQGHCGYRGGKCGHLFVTINVEPHQIFKWVDDNIYVDVPLTIKQCLLGGTVNVPTLNGNMDLLIKPRTYPNSEKVLKGKGPCKVDSYTNGDLIIKFSLKIPEKLTPNQVELIEEFNRIELNLHNTQHTNKKKNNHDNKMDSQEIFNKGNNDNTKSTNEGDKNINKTRNNNENVHIKNANNNNVNTNNSNSTSKDNFSIPEENMQDKSIPEPPFLHTKKNISNIEMKNSSNIPIPPLPPKSSSSLKKNEKDNEVKGNEAKENKAQENEAKGKNKGNKMHNNFNSTLAYASKSAFASASTFATNTHDNYAKNLRNSSMNTSEYGNSTNVNNDMNNSDNGAYIFDKNIKESSNFCNHLNKNNKSDKSYEKQNDEKDNTSAFSYSKQWLFNKFKPKN